jgi:hypothetical protein
MMHSTLLERILERPSDVPLPDDLGEGLRAVLASEDEIGHATIRAADATCADREL